MGLKPSDIILASYPKSGSTWFRFFLCNLISVAEWSGREIDFSLEDNVLEFDTGQFNDLDGAAARILIEEDDQETKPQE